MVTTLDKLAATYLDTLTEADFEALYSEFNRVYGSRYQIIANQFDGDVHSVQADYEDTLLNVLERYRPGKGVFSHYLNKALKNARLGLARKSYKRETDITLFPMLAHKTDIEQEVINQLNNQLFKTKIYQLAAIDSLKTYMVLVELYRGKPLYQTAINFGVCPKNIKKRLRKVLQKVDNFQAMKPGTDFKDRKGKQQYFVCSLKGEPPGIMALFDNKPSRRGRKKKASTN